MNIEYSVIIACFNEEGTINEFHHRLKNTLTSLTKSYEIIFVDDGSSDETVAMLKNLFEIDTNISTIIELSNNCGQEAALTAGFTYGQGKYFVIMDSDLQLAPEELPLLIAEKEKGCDIVGGYRVKRKDPINRKVLSFLLGLLTPWVIQFPIRDIGCSFRIFDARLIKAFEPGPNRIFHLYYAFERAKKYGEVPVTHLPRKQGNSGWTYWKLLGLFADNFIGFLHHPFLAIGIATIASIFCFIVSIIIILFDIILAPEHFYGQALFLMVGFCIILNLIILSVVGELALRAYIILIHKPAYVCRTIRRRSE